MSRKILILILASFMVAFCGKKLPPLENLKELDLQPVADFTSREDVGRVSDADITDDGKLVFFDARKGLEVVEGDSLRTIGGFGQGPGEYTYITSLWVEGGKIYTLHVEDKIIVYSLDGKVLWQRRLPADLDRIVGEIGDRLLLSGTFFSEKGGKGDLYLWGKDAPLTEILQLPVATFSQRRGKRIEIFIISRPVYALIGDRIFASASPSYQFSFYDLKGRKLKTVKFKAPAPTVPILRKIKNARNVEPFSVLYAAACGGKLCLITGYYRKNHPRFDVFTSQGEYLRSYILPLKYEYIGYRFKIRKGYLFYINPDDTGFRVYRLPGEF